MNIKLFGLFAVFTLLIACKDQRKEISTGKDQVVIESAIITPDDIVVQKVKRNNNWGGKKSHELYTEFRQINQAGYFYKAFIARKGNYFGIVDSLNNVVIDFLFPEIIKGNKSFAVKTNTRFHFFVDAPIARNSKTLDSLINANNGFFIGIKGDKQKVILHDGSEISTRWYREIDFPRIPSFFYAREEEQWLSYSLEGVRLDPDHEASQTLVNLNKHRVTLKSIGKIRLGMPTEELGTVIGQELKSDFHDSENCHTFQSNNIKLTFLTEKDKKGVRRLERIYILQRGIKTKSGIGIGSTEQALISAYGDRMEKQPNHYDSEASDYFYVPKDSFDKEYRMNFMVKDGIIRHYSIGRLPAIQYVEACF